MIASRRTDVGSVLTNTLPPERVQGVSFCGVHAWVTHVHITHQVTCAAVLAVAHVNQRNGSVASALADLDNVSISYTMYDTGGVEMGGITGYRAARAAGANAIVGVTRMGFKLAWPYPCEPEPRGLQG